MRDEGRSKIAEKPFHFTCVRSIISGMSTVAEIEDAIRALPPTERERLAQALPSILPELRGEIVWQRIIEDERPRPALSALGDEIEAAFKDQPDQFPEIEDIDFERRL